MSSILVIEQDESYAEQIVEALKSTGREIDIVARAEHVLAYTANRRPRLVLASASFPDAKHILGHFSRRQGGPGSIVMMPINLMGEVTAEDYQADALLTKPFSSDDLARMVERWLEQNDAPPQEVSERPDDTGREEEQAPAQGARQPSAVIDLGDSRQLTSEDIFGDVLAEVEAAAEAAGRPAAKPPARPDSDLEQRLEQTLSGVLDLPGSRRRRPAGEGATARTAGKAARRGPLYSEEEIDQLLDETLSSLHLPTRPRSRAEATPELPSAAEPAEAPQDFDEAARLEPPRLEEFEDEPPGKLEEQAASATSAAPPAEALDPPAMDDFRTQRLTPLGESPDSTAGIPFGEYSLLRRIAVGGMAEVWQARRRGVEGFQKTVAIKKILWHLTDSSDFVNMFIDEAKLAAQLNHNNIIQIYDLGKVGSDYFIAMEFVDGKDLRSILRQGREREQPLPMGLALMIAARLARALDYAHRKRGFDDRELGLVHRDVSPQNVLISFEGEIKLCDFGIVKAVAKVSTTQMGALKGKLQYMSPEQAWGKTVDSRSDIFSVGSVLFEMLTGQKLFTAETEVGVLDAVRDCSISPPSSLIPSIPVEVDHIVLKALAKDPEERYQTAGEMEQEIDAFLHTLQPRPGEADLTSYLQKLFPPGAEVPPEAAERPSTATPPSLSGVSFLAPSPAVAGEPNADISQAADGVAAAEDAADDLELADLEPTDLEPTALESVEPEDLERDDDLESAVVTDPNGAFAETDVEEAAAAPARRGKLVLVVLILALLAALAVFFFLRWQEQNTPAAGPSATVPAATPGPLPEPVPPTPTPADDVETTTAAGDETVGEADDTGAATGTAEPPAEEVAAGEDAAGEDAAGVDAGEVDGAAIPSDLEKIVDEELAKRAEQIRQELEARRQQLEAELEEARRAEEATAEEPSDDGSSQDPSTQR